MFWQRKNETPPLDPAGGRHLRPSEPFMDPASESETGTAAMEEPESLADDASETAADGPAPRQSIRPAELDTDELPTVSEGGQKPLPQPPHRPFSSAPDGPADDLKQISGVGPKLEETLNEEGITTFAQLAALDDAEVDALQERIGGVAGRIRREEWVAQAKKLL